MAKAEQVADRFANIYAQLMDLHDSKDLQTMYLQAVMEFLIIITDRMREQPGSTLTPDETRRMGYIDLLCTGKLTAKVFQKTWDMIDRRPQPGPAAATTLRIA